MRARPALLALLFVTGCAVAPDTRRSGFEDMSPATQAMQKDDSENPAMLWVKDGEQLWSRPGANSKSCASCHGDMASMRGVAARYPAWDAPLSRPVNLGTRIKICRERHQGERALPPEHAQLLALETAVAMQSRGMAIAPPEDTRLAPARERGARWFSQRIGQLDLSCAQCHTERAGSRLAGNVIPEGHATGYPIYRLEWQGMGSLSRRIRNCMTGVRAEPFAYGSAEMAEIELHLATRAMGMKIETPAVRP